MNKNYFVATACSLICLNYIPKGYKRYLPHPCNKQNNVGM